MKSPNSLQAGFLANLKHDFPASIVVFLVAVPLCLGIALASGAPLFSGIISGIVGGIIVGSFSGSQLGVSGPAAGLAVIVLTTIEDLGGFDIFLLAVVIAGIIQILLGIARAGIIGYYFPSSVIKGMLSGIGIIIILKQIPHAFGYDKDFEGDVFFNQADGHNTLSELYYMLDFISPGATIIAVVSMLLLMLWELPFMKKQRIFQIIQGPLMVVIAGILLNLFFQSMPQFALKPEQVVSIPVSDSVTGFFGQFSLPDFSQITNPNVWVAAIVVAVVASLETLLCLEATDKLDPFKRVAPANRELRAQGIGNLLAGLIGGLPVTQVIVRSSTNIQSGGRTKASAIFHGIIMLGCVVTIPFVLNLIPLASLAAILFLVGYKLAKPALFRQMYKLGWSQFLPFIITILGIVFKDLLFGIGLGMVVAIFHILRNNFKKPYFFSSDTYKEGEPIRIVLGQDVTFLNKAAILQTLNHIPENSNVIIDASNSVNIDQDVIEIIEDFGRGSAYKNIELKLIHRKEKDALGDPFKEFERTILNGSKEKNKEVGEKI